MFGRALLPVLCAAPRRRSHFFLNLLRKTPHRQPTAAAILRRFALQNSPGGGHSGQHRRTPLEFPPTRPNFKQGTTEKAQQGKERIFFAQRLRQTLWRLSYPLHLQKKYIVVKQCFLLPPLRSGEISALSLPLTQFF